MVRLTSRYELPIPMTGPITGQDLLAVINTLFDPIRAVAMNEATATVASLSPLRVTVAGSAATVPAWPIPAYTPVQGDVVVVLVNTERAIILGVAPAGAA